jgi:hypothetical protein
MNDQVNRLLAIRNEISLCVKLSRGKWSKIHREAGVRRYAMKRLASSADYMPNLADLVRLDAWFSRHPPQ